MERSPEEQVRYDRIMALTEARDKRNGTVNRAWDEYYLIEDAIEADFEKAMESLKRSLPK